MVVDKRHFCLDVGGENVVFAFFRLICAVLEAERGQCSDIKQPMLAHHAVEAISNEETVVVVTETVFQISAEIGQHGNH